MTVPMINALTIIAVIGAVCFALGIAILVFRWMSWPLIRARQDAPRLAAERRRRLASPDWGFYERHLGRPIPAALKDLYSDVEALNFRGSIEYSDELSLAEFARINHIAVTQPVNAEQQSLYLSEFSPIDEKALEETREWLGLDVVAIAWCDGGAIHLRPGSSESDFVCFANDEICDSEAILPSVDELLLRVKDAQTPFPSNDQT
jgi:hypothetical protein